jgi:AmmeMemoRadiSam system protein B
MDIREPVVAGAFYPGGAEACARHADECLAPDPAPREPIPGILGGIAPHAGWAYSGHTAGRLFRALLDRGRPPAVILFLSAQHVFGPERVAVYLGGPWTTPLGEAPVDGPLTRAILDEAGRDTSADSRPHFEEHSAEVLLPLAQRLFPGVSIAVAMVPPVEEAIPFGEAAARALRKDGREFAVVASSDLTHYGPNYGFTPQGVGPQALEWVRKQNDARIVERFLALDAPGILQEAARHRNACGAGAAAAGVACARALGARRGVLLEYTTSHDVRPRGRPVDFVGYAAVAFDAGGAP